MKKYTTEELIALGYKIENAKITSVDISMADHGCVTLNLTLEGDGWGCCYGGYCLGHGYLNAKDFDSSPNGIEYIARIMDTVGVEQLNSMLNKHIRIATKGWGSIIKIIGNIVQDKWFDAESFFSDYKE